MKIRIESAPSQRGAALLLSLLAVLAVGAISASLSSVQSTMASNQKFSEDRRAALYVAEAGIAEASLAISQGRSGALASEEIPATFGAGLFWVEAEDLAGGSIELRCTAQVRTAEFVLRTNIKPNHNPVTSRGFFGIEGVSIGRGTLVDGFDSSKGTYETQVTATTPHRTTGLTGRLGSLGQVVIEGSSGGSAGAGEASAFSWQDLLGNGDTPGRRPADRDSASSTPTDPTTSSGVTVNASATESVTLLHADIDGFVLSSGDVVLDGTINLDAPGFIPPPALPPSTFTTLLDDLLVSGSQVGIGTSACAEIQGDLIIRPGSSLRLEGPLVLSLETLRIEEGAELLLDDATGPILVFLRSGMQCAAGSRMESVAAEPAALGTAICIKPPTTPRTAFSLPQEGRFHGSLYAPGDRVVVPAALRWLGAITARQLETEPGARLSFDVHLTTGSQTVSATPRIAAWQIVPVGDGLARRLAIDPKLALSLRGITPVPSSEAAPESYCEVILLDDAGAPATFSGPISDLLVDVQRVMSMRWVDVRNGTLRRWMRPAGADIDGSISAYREKVRQVRDSLEASAISAKYQPEEMLAKLAAGLSTDQLIKPIEGARPSGAGQ